MTTKADFIVETFLVRRVRSRSPWQPWHGTFLTGRGFALRNKAFIEQQLIDRQELGRIFDLPDLESRHQVPTNFPPVPPGTET